MSSRPPVLVLSGPPGAGKTTVARLLARRYARGVHLESDRFFHFIAAGYVDPWRRESQAQNRVVMQIVADAAAGYARAGYFTIVDGIVIPGWFLQPLQVALNSEGLVVAYAVLRASKATCVSRAGSRSEDKLANTEAIGQLWQEFAELGELESHVFDSESIQPEQIAELLAAELHDKLLLPSAEPPEP